MFEVIHEAYKINITNLTHNRDGALRDASDAACHTAWLVYSFPSKLKNIYMPLMFNENSWRWVSKRSDEMPGSCIYLTIVILCGSAKYKSVFM